MEEINSNKSNNNEVPVHQALSSVTAKQSKPRVLATKKNIIVSAVIILVFILSILGIFVKLRTDKEKTLIQRSAYGKYNTGDYKSSIEVAMSGLKQYPDDKFFLKTILNSNSSLGNQTGLETKKFEDAKPYLERAIKIGVKDAETQIAIGYAYETAGAFELALSFFERAISLDPQLANAYFHRGHVLEFLGRGQEATTAYEEAYKLDPKDAVIQVAIGNLFLKKNEPEKALELYLEAGNNTKATYSIRADAFSAAALVESQMGRYPQALDHAKQARKLNSRSSLASGLYGFSASLLGNYQEGLPALNESIQLNPRISMNFMFLGVVLRQLGYYDKAANFQLDGIAKIDNDNTIIGVLAKNKMKAKMYYELAQTYSLIPNEDKAIENLRNAINLVDYRNQIKKDAGKGYYFAKLKGSSKFIGLLN